ncbi:MAG: ABC transporter permease [Treponema sp. GWB1_62_6]|nr:MAG: ABC transporter permease [Treponema sp. GWB1_62_6]HCM26228.1 carbohydrate ABC transporter permease [Treponema sp.]
MKSLRRARRAGSNTLAHIVLSTWTVLVLFPLWTMIANSFKFKYDIYKDPFGLPVKWNFDSYLSVLRDSDFIRFFRNSLVVTVGSIAAVLFFGALAAYALANWRAKPSRWIYAFFIAGMMLPIKIGSIRLLQMVKALGLIDTIWSLYPVYISMGLPVAVFVLTEFIREIPRELTEAAVIDGAGRFRIFRSIIVHLLRPALATVAIFNLVPFWNDLWFPLIFISDDRHKTLLLGVTRLFGQYQTDWSKILAVLTLAAVPVILLYLSMSKQFIKGLTAGAVKG